VVAVKESRLRASQRQQTRAAQATSEEAQSPVEGIYAALAELSPARACQSLAQCCRFQLTGKVPHLTKGEALYLARGLRASGRTKVPDSPEGACPLLGKTQRCVAYAHRPFGCRTHFCAAAGGPMERRSVIALIHQLETLDEQLGGDGAKPLRQALKEALAGD